MNCRHVVFLMFLLSLVLFLAGFRLGKKIEQIDKNHLAFNALTPSPTSFSQKKPLSFVVFSSFDCGIKFLYPNSFKKEETATGEGKLKFQDEEIYLTCQKEKIDEFQKNKSLFVKEKEMTVLNQNTILLKHPQKNYLLFSFINPKTKKTILFTVSPNLLPLILETLRFL